MGDRRVPQYAGSNPGAAPLTLILRRSLVWLGVVPLVVIGLVSAVGRGLALATGDQPFAALYAILPPGGVEDGRTLDRWFASHSVLTWTHIAAGTLVFAFALFQFVPVIRRRHVTVHRWTGRLVLVAAVPAAISGMLLQARSPYGGLLADSAIFLAGALFLTALVLAYRAIRRGDTVRHREWMIRMLAVALGVGTVRLVAFPLVFLTGRRPLELIGVGFWLGFAISIGAGEIWIRSKRVAPASLTPSSLIAGGATQ